jgi:hypothetical protein
MVNTGLNNTSLVGILSIQIFFTCDTLYYCLVCSDFLDTNLSHNYASCPACLGNKSQARSSWSPDGLVEKKMSKIFSAPNSFWVLFINPIWSLILEKYTFLGDKHYSWLIQEKQDRHGRQMGRFRRR